MNKTELIEKIKTLYPYYTRVNSMKKANCYNYTTKTVLTYPSSITKTVAIWTACLLHFSLVIAIRKYLIC